MQAIKCELCGSNQLIKKDGCFQCEHCGTKYTLEEAKKLIVSGTVEVSKGEAEKEDLLKNGNLFISENDFENANKVYEILHFQYPDDPFVKRYATELVFKKTIYECELEKKKILTQFVNFCKHLSSGRTASKHSFHITDYLSNINQKREFLTNQGIDDLSLIDNIEFNIIETYNTLSKNNHFKNHFEKQLIFDYNKCYFTETYIDKYTFSKITSKWIQELTEKFLDEVNQGENSFQELLYYGDFDTITSSIVRKKLSLPNVNTQFWNVFVEGIECGKFLNSNKCLLDDLLLDEMYVYNYSEEILFAYGNSISVITDTEYGISTTKYKTKTIIDLSHLQMLASKKNPNMFCKKCGGALRGLFSKTCTRCGAKY